MINLDRVRKMLDGEVVDLIEGLDGIDLDDVDSIESQTKTKARTYRANKTRELLLLESRLVMAAQLVKNEYWFAKGELDPLDPERDTGDYLNGDEEPA